MKPQIVLLFVLIFPAAFHVLVGGAAVSEAEKVQTLVEEDNDDIRRHSLMLKSLFDVYDTTRQLQPDVAAREDEERIACGIDYACKMRAAQTTLDSADESSKTLANIRHVAEEQQIRGLCPNGHVGPFGSKCEICGAYITQFEDD